MVYQLLNLIKDLLEFNFNTMLALFLQKYEYNQLKLTFRKSTVETRELISYLFQVLLLLTLNK